MKFSIFNYLQKELKFYCEVKHFYKTLNRKDKIDLLLFLIVDRLVQQPITFIFNFTILLVFYPFYFIGKLAEFCVDELKISEKAWFFQSKRRKIYGLFRDFKKVKNKI